MKKRFLLLIIIVTMLASSVSAFACHDVPDPSNSDVKDVCNVGGHHVHVFATPSEGGDVFLDTIQFGELNEEGVWVDELLNPNQTFKDSNHALPHVHAYTTFKVSQKAKNGYKFVDYNIIMKDGDGNILDNSLLDGMNILPKDEVVPDYYYNRTGDVITIMTKCTGIRFPEGYEQYNCLAAPEILFEIEAKFEKIQNPCLSWYQRLLNYFRSLFSRYRNVRYTYSRPSYRTRSYSSYYSRRCR